MGLSCARRFNFIAKEELFKGFQGWFIGTVGAFPIKRDAADFRALREALRRLKKGPLVIFPEGTRGVGDREKKPQAGIGFLAQKSDVPVIPVYIEGSDKAHPEGSKWIKFHPVRLYIGAPVVLDKSLSYEEIAEEIIDAIYRLKPSLPHP